MSKFQNVHSRLSGVFLPKATLSRSKWLVDTWKAHSDVINAKQVQIPQESGPEFIRLVEATAQKLLLTTLKGGNSKWHASDAAVTLKMATMKITSHQEPGAASERTHETYKRWPSNQRQNQGRIPGTFCCTDGRGTKPHFQRGNRKSTFFHPHDCLCWGGYVLEFICQVARSMFAGTQWIS